MTNRPSEQQPQQLQQQRQQQQQQGRQVLLDRLALHRGPGLGPVTPTVPWRPPPPAPLTRSPALPPLSGRVSGRVRECRAKAALPPAPVKTPVPMSTPVLVKESVLVLLLVPVPVLVLVFLGNGRRGNEKSIDQVQSSLPPPPPLRRLGADMRRRR